MIISVVSAKGGVGKTTFVANISLALSRYFGKRVLVVDANLTTPTLSIHFGIMPQISLFEVLEEKASLAQAIYNSHGVDLLPTSMIREEPYPEPEALKSKLEEIKNSYDFIFIDGAAGIGKEAISAMKASDRVIIVSNPELTSLMAALKVLRISKILQVPVLGVVLNKSVKSLGLSKQEAERMLDIPVIGVIPFDKNISKAINKMQPVVAYKPDSPASLAFQIIAGKLVGAQPKLPFKYKLYKLLGKF